VSETSLSLELIVSHRGNRVSFLLRHPFTPPGENDQGVAISIGPRNRLDHSWLLWTNGWQKIVDFLK